MCAEARASDFFVPDTTMTPRAIHRLNAALIALYVAMALASVPRVKRLWVEVAPRLKSGTRTGVVETFMRDHPIVVWLAFPTTLLLVNVVVAFLSRHEPTWLRRREQRRLQALPAELREAIDALHRRALGWIGVGTTIASATISIELLAIVESIAFRRATWIAHFWYAPFLLVSVAFALAVWYAGSARSATRTVLDRGAIVSSRGM
jgi:hypothetical protein